MKITQHIHSKDDNFELNEMEEWTSDLSECNAMQCNNAWVT